MQSLAERVAALDPDAGSAVGVIAYFDQLIERRAGLEAVVRGAAVLSGAVARLDDPDRRVRIRVTPDGRRTDDDPPARPEWPSVPVFPGEAAAVRLESTRKSVVHDLILERAALVAGVVTVRVRGRAPVAADPDDPALTETVVDPEASESTRLLAAEALGLSAHAQARAVARVGGGMHVQSADAPVSSLPGRVGVGPAVPVLELPRSATAARTALRFTADGTAHDPGPRIVHADELGGLDILARALDADTPPPPDVATLLREAAETPWLLQTLSVVSHAASLRSAAGELHLHHSTLQERISYAERRLGWPLRTPAGRLRLQLALAARLLTRRP
ncbi:helix-turn-helix domain-containing protein [Streptomyces sp. S465]|uniref:helix-turn-helix domain-containing protein n=1 Tax=Streptomyces sp. S465 TaxID=2979468 RepID=UPI0022A84853|nr:helix-turn-helix domain-containing protein [Streptomyces sp. S465]WAP60175.1 helix-turn-helix domain-containing protein [Streptomyces sp. S465]